MSDAIAQHLGTNVRKLREARGLTQQQMAKLAGVPRPTWANLESGQANPTLAVLARVADALQVRLEELIEGRLTIEAIGNSSMRTLVTLHGADDASLRAEIRLLTVHVDLPDGRPSPVPDSVRQAFGFPVREVANG